MISAQINEIFDSIQGEGPYIGYRQVFIRFCGCNLNCDYCDTEFLKGNSYTPHELAEKIRSYNLDAVHSISITGGEPLIHYEFLQEFFPLINKKIYLETNGILALALESVIEMTDIISMDIKLNSSTKIGDVFSQHEEFLNVATKFNKEIFAKIVFDENIKDYEIHDCIRLANKFQIPIILQPKMDGNIISIDNNVITETLKKFTEKYPNTRMIGQVHKFFNIR